MRRTFKNCSPAFMERARTAMDYSDRVFLHNGSFWRVLWIHYEYRHVGVEPARSLAPFFGRRSIDDCTPEEWHAAVCENDKALTTCDK